jgi:hypothetical protein
MKVVKIVVPATYKLPDFYKEATTPQQRGLALTLGVDAITYFQKKAVDRLRAETHEEAVRQAAATYEAQLAEAKTASDQLIAKLRAEKQKSEDAVHAAALRLEALEASAASLRGQAQRDAREALGELLAAKDEQITRLQALLERQVEAMSGKMEALQHSITKTFSSSKEKGALGETLMEGFLKKAFDCDVCVVSKEAQTADIRMTRSAGATYFWEIKNYTRMVSNEEVEKFRRDLRLHPDVRGGCLVSLRTGIVGHTRGGDVSLEFLEDGRFILYLSHFMSREDPVFSLQGLRPFFDTVEQVAKPAVQEEGAAVRALEAKATLIANLLRSHVQTVARHKNSVLGHKKRVDAMFTEFQGFLLEEEAQLQSLLRVAMGGEEEVEAAAADADILLSPVVFSRAKMSDVTDEKARKFLRWLLETCEVQEGAVLEVKDVLERAKGLKISEKCLRGLRDDLFQEAAWGKGGRQIVGLRWKGSP